MESVGIFQQEGPVIIGWFFRHSPDLHKTTVLIENQIEIIPFPGIVPDPEIPDKSMIGVIELYECTYR